ncbi:MAG: ScpA family protein [Nanoarchaeota archaeon]
MEDKILQIIVDQNEISWKAMIFDLVKSEGMNPWDVDIGLIAQKYIQKLKNYKELDLKMSGKVLLASAVLLRMKSKRLLDEDLSEFDRLLASTEVTEEQFYDSLEQELAKGEKLAVSENFELLPRTPQPRKRKVSVYDLVLALEKALEVKKRRLDRNVPLELKMPQRKFDITSAMTNVFGRIIDFFKIAGEKLTFSKLANSDKKEDKVYTFIPLLHLSNQEKVELKQEKNFGEIEIILKEEVEQNESNKK